MGASSFRIVRVAPGYFWALMRTIGRVWRGQRDFRLPGTGIDPAGRVGSPVANPAHGPR